MEKRRPEEEARRMRRWIKEDERMEKRRPEEEARRMRRWIEEDKRKKQGGCWS